MSGKQGPQGTTCLFGTLNIVSSAGSRTYLDEYGIDRLFKDMLTCLLEDRPSSPLDYLIEGLRKVKAAPVRPVSFLHFFHSPSAPRGGNEHANGSNTGNGDGKDNDVGYSGSINNNEGNKSDNNNKDNDQTMYFDIDELQKMSFQDNNNSNDPLPAGFPTSRRQSVSAESYQPGNADEERSEEAAVVVPKCPGSRKRIEQAVKNNLLFKNLEPEQRNRILDAMFEKLVQAGETVIRQGDPGDNFYVIESGRFRVSVNGDEKDVLEAGMTFGELALMYNCPRTATVSALEDGILWAVDRTTFSRTIIDLAYRKRKMYEGFLRSVPLLTSLTDLEVCRIADALEPCEYKEGQVVIKEGDMGENFYIIVSGEAIVNDKDGNELNRLRSGDYFGELALLERRPRSATVVARTDLKCVALAESAFQRLLGPLNEIMQRNQERYSHVVS